MYLIDSMNNNHLDGSIWVAVWGGAAVRRFDQTGELIGVIPMPVTRRPAARSVPTEPSTSPPHGTA